MQAGEALSLLSAGLPADQVALERATLVELAARLGEWAQLLKIVNGFLRDRVVKANESLAVAVAGANQRLDARGLVAFDPRDEADRTKAVARTIGISLELLAETDRARFGEIGVFPEDAEIPVGVAALLWAANGGLEEFETEDLLGRLYDLSLLLDLDLGQRSFRLHDTVRHFLRDRVGKEGLVAQHKQLVAALDGVPNEETDARTRSYYYLHLPHHLAEAKERDRLDTLLLDPGWLKAKLEATANSSGAGRRLSALWGRRGTKSHWQDIALGRRHLCARCASTAAAAHRTPSRALRLLARQAFSKMLVGLSRVQVLFPLSPRSLSPVPRPRGSKDTPEA